MTVYKRTGSDFYWVEFVYKGERIRRSSETTSKRKAEEFERRLRTELHDQAVMGKVAEMTWGDAIDRYYDGTIAPRGNKEAGKRDLYVLNSLREELGENTPITKLTARIIAEYRDSQLQKDKAPATVNRYLSMIKAILRKANSDWGGLHVVPVIKLMKLNNERYRWITYKEEENLLANSSEHLKNLCIFLLDTGTRLSEATTLTWTDVDLERTPRPLAKFMETKSGKPRSVPLTKRVEAMLRTFLKNKPEDENRVFLYRAPGKDKAVPFRNPHGAWYSATEKAKLHDVNIHDLRHTFASRLVMRGVPLLTVSKLLGHSTIQMTMRYAHLAPDAFDSAIEMLEHDGRTKEATPEARSSTDAQEAFSA